MVDFFLETKRMVKLLLIPSRDVEFSYHIFKHIIERQSYQRSCSKTMLVSVINSSYGKSTPSIPFNGYVCLSFFNTTTTQFRNHVLRFFKRSDLSFFNAYLQSNIPRIALP